ncbi:hypothetical protein K3495_g10169 [Podosphaera aphanis]|nr:hypothetical protein K3495_g10169 [Podosphaera aphanis]
MAPQTVLEAKLKVQLKLSIARLRMVQRKDEAVSKQLRRAMAQLLEAGKFESAKIRVENIIRSDLTTELHEILELYCELLLARTRLLEGPVCDPGLEEAVKSLIYAAPRTEIKELQQVRALLCEKFGKEFALLAMENSDHKVSENVLKKLTAAPPPQELVHGYLEEIARTYGVDWPKSAYAELQAPVESRDAKDAGDDDDNDENPSGGQRERKPERPMTCDNTVREELSKAAAPQCFGPSSPLRINPPSPSTENPRPKVKGPSEIVPRQNGNTKDPGKNTKDSDIVGGKIPDIDELAARFAALKR